MFPNEDRLLLETGDILLTESGDYLLLESSSLVICRIAFDSSPMDASPVWTDVSDSLMSVSIKRGRQYEMNRIEAGTATIVLNNISGDFWPDTAGTYTGKILPLKRINIRVDYNGVIYDLYTGYIESWTPDFILKPITAPVMIIKAVDLQKSLSMFLLNNAGYAQELSGTRVTNVLTSLGWLGSTTISTGISNMQATGALSDSNAMTHLYTVQDSEMGLFFILPSGVPTFQDRHFRTTDAKSITSQATFGDVPATDLGYTGVLFAYDDFYIYNDVRLTRTGGAEQAVTDSTSITSYGQRTLAETGLFLTSDTECLIGAKYLLAHFKDPAMRTRQITINSGSSGMDLTKQFSLEISNRITVRLTQGSVLTEYFIEGLEERWSIQNPVWITTYQLFDTNWLEPTIPATNETIRPATTSASNNIEAYPSGTIPGVLSDNDAATYVRRINGQVNYYVNENIADPSYPHGTINSVTLYWMVRRWSDVADTCNLYEYVGGNLYTEFASLSPSYSGWDTKSKAYTLSPDSGIAWTWTEVNGLIMGFSGTCNFGDFYGLTCAEMWAVVNYNPIW